MPKPSPELYNLKKTAFWFAIASIVLLIGLLAMIFEDSNREWKGWQRKSMDYTRGGYGKAAGGSPKNNRSGSIN